MTTSHSTKQKSVVRCSCGSAESHWILEVMKEEGGLGGATSVDPLLVEAARSSGRLLNCARWSLRTGLRVEGRALPQWASHSPDSSPSSLRLKNLSG